MDCQYSLTLSAAPAAEPLTTAQAKAHLVIDSSFTDDDTLIDSYIKAARQHVEDVTGRQIYTATWVLRMDAFPPTILLPKPPLSSITSLAYVDSAGSAQTLTADEDYSLDAYSVPARIVPYVGCSWPSTYGHINDVTVTYVAGYGTSESSFPAPILHAMRLLIADLYEHREESVVQISITARRAVDALLAPYIVYEGI